MPSTSFPPDPAIEQNRDLALSLLSPTPAQIQRGLELHAHATVIDAYGFSAIASPDLPSLFKARDQGAAPSHLARLLAQGLMTNMASDPLQAHYFSQAWAASGVTCVNRNSGEESNLLERLIRRLGHNTFVTDALPQTLTRATTPDDIRAAKAAGKHCFLFTTNAVPLQGRLDSIESELSLIPIFRQLGVRMMHMTYNRRNLIGDGCAELSDGGLSDLGIHAVAVMNQQGVIPDLAHSSARTALDTARHTTKPIVVSHACCQALNNHCRNKSDALMRAVADTGGFVGIAAMPAFLGGDGTIRAFLDHIHHAVTTIGIDHVAIGTDVPYFPPGFHDAMAQAQTLPPSEVKVFDSLWPPNDALFRPEWNQPHMLQSLAWTNWPIFTVGLVQRGYSDSQILKLLGANFLRVLQAT
jgi:membrane dipeptidase